MDRLTINDFLSGFDDKCYPEAFLNKYELLECLANNLAGETLLVQDRFGKRYVAKCYNDASLLSKTTESELLKDLHRDGLPALVEEFRSDTMLCVVREFIPGVPLNQLGKPMSEAQALSVGAQLCDILSYLHGQTPPVIHRDIKPQNIIMDENGKVTLIDFGISRIYDAAARADTVFFGTQEFAPPEQYGFSQTDSRADIFSLGVVLAWLITGRTKLEGIRIRNRRLERIVRRCTAFSPNDRYRSADSVKRALLNADGHKFRFAVKTCCAALALFAALTAGFAIGRFTDVRPVLFYDHSTAVFSDMLVEQAVQSQLGKADGEPIKTEELGSVTELYIYADQLAGSWDEFFSLRSAVDSGKTATGGGQVASLADISQLPNLEHLGVGSTALADIAAVVDTPNLSMLVLSNASFTDITAVGTLKKLYQLTMDNCHSVTDISPLAGCTSLKQLVMTGCRAEDFSVMASLGDLDGLHLQQVEPEKFLPYLKGKTIRQLKLGYQPLSSVGVLAEIEGIEDLILDDMSLASLDGVENLTSLKYLSLSSMPQLSLEPLLNLPNLETLTLSEDMRETAQSIEQRASFDIKYQ